jgi:hypothetical protein
MGATNVGISLERPLDGRQRASFLEKANVSYAALRSDPRAWADELAERKLWDNAGADGLESE